MRISSSDIGMESSRNYSSYQESSVTTVVMVGANGLLSDWQEQAKEDAAGNLVIGQEAKEKYDGETTFEEKKKALQEKLNEMSSYSGVRKLSYLKNERDAFCTVREQCMQYLLAIFFGETKRWDYTELLSTASRNASLSSGITETAYTHKEVYYQESEETSFFTKGTVRTEDGRELSFGLNVEMSRSFASYYTEDYLQQRTKMCDPLVINLEGNIAELSDQTFFFDIDADGEKDEIAALKKGSGYLALDRNEDGTINDGSELFGAKSGNGFADLAIYDADSNGWIDENDEIWKKLLIWTKDENGKDMCYKLSEKGVGAICLSNVSTDFSLKDAQNATNGRIRRTGIFLYESGMAGTIQHLDVAKQEQSFDVAG